MTEQKRVIRKDLSQIEKLELRCVHIVIKWFKSFRTTLENDRNDRFWAMCLPVILKIIDNEFLREKLHYILQMMHLKTESKEDIVLTEQIRAEQHEKVEEMLNQYPCVFDVPLFKGKHHDRKLVLLINNIISSISSDEMQEIAAADGTEPINDALSLLANYAKLSRAEVHILDMVTMRYFDSAFNIIVEDLRCNPHQVPDFLATAIDCSKGDVVNALSKQSSIVQMQLIDRLSLSRGEKLDGVLGCNHALAMMLLREPSTYQELVAVFADPPATAQWKLADFPHMQKEGHTAVAVLQKAASTAEPGINALLYGTPGTGKTEFAYALAAEAGFQTYRVKTEDDNGEPMDRKGRLAAYMILQRLLGKHRKTGLIFDEAEDVFGQSGDFLAAMFGNSKMAGQNKGWMNRALEENAVPAIWITNNARSMDTAFLRRFLLPIAFRTPPVQVRRQMVRAHLPAKLVPDALLEQLAADDKLQPAQFGLASRLVKLLPGRDAAQTVQHGIAASRRLLHGSGLPRQRQSATVFDIDYLHVAGGIAPAHIVQALRRTGQGRLCFFGIPGTGKTEFAHMLAQTLGRELISRSGADLLDMYVGGTEKAIAAAFADADPENTVLLLDEVDSLLRCRKLAQRSWETTQVNELLQQMENYPGILIAATNQVQQLDAAALRRFDFKLEFRPLKPQQRLALFARELLGSAQRQDELPELVRERLLQMDGLTVGDFANVARQAKLLGEALPPEDYLRRLMLELRHKQMAEAVAAH